MTEVWLPVKGYEGIYEVSSLGRVRSLTRRVDHRHYVTTRQGQMLKPLLHQARGYLRVSLNRDGSAKVRDIHLLVAEAFLGDRPDGFHVCHNNGDSQDNRVSNLRYDTPSANNYDKRRHGTDHEVKKTHCPQGHPYSPENTYVYRNRRNCRTCSAAHKAAYRARKAAEHICTGSAA